MTLREAAQLAYMALDAQSWEQINEARAALRTALSAPYRAGLGQPLTEKQIKALAARIPDETPIAEGKILFARAIERAHGIGNSND